MSLPDYLLDDEDGMCEGCGALIQKSRGLCSECKKDNEDLYADMEIQDEKEGL